MPQFLALAALLTGPPASSTNSAGTAAQQPLIVAHRGASYDAPENTLPAFELAWRRGADAIEGDFYLTADRKIVCCHDKTTGRYADHDLVVKDSTLAELQALDVGRWKSPQFAGTRMPTLDDVLACVPSGKRIYVEVKCGPEIVAPMLQAFQASTLDRSQIVVISFDASVIKAFKRSAPRYRAYWLSGFKVSDDGSITPTAADVLSTLQRTHADGFSSSKDLVSRTLIEAVDSAGFEYHVWTVDNARVADRFRDWGADSITTNRPGYLRRRLGQVAAELQLGP